jgi:hypothetical protein
LWFFKSTGNHLVSQTASEDKRMDIPLVFESISGCGQQTFLNRSLAARPFEQFLFMGSSLWAARSEKVTGHSGIMWPSSPSLRQAQVIRQFEIVADHEGGSIPCSSPERPVGVSGSSCWDLDPAIS